MEANLFANYLNKIYQSINFILNNVESGRPTPTPIHACIPKQSIN